MLSLASDYLLLFWAAFSVLAIGVAVCARVTPLNGIGLLGYGAAAGVAAHGLFGLLIAVSWHTRHIFAALPLLCTAVALVDLTRRKEWGRVATSLTKPLRVSLLLYMLFVVVCVALVHAQVRWPETLQSGMFIFQKHRLNTKVQHMTGLPADNYIPYTVTEYLLRGISFKEHHPILPGNEVSNRTILMSLVVLPFRTALTWQHEWQSGLGKFAYIDSTWPDVESLNDDGSFSQFEVIGIFLNSLLLLGLIVFFAQWNAAGALPIALIFAMTNAYFISQTIFTWPKAMAGFFILLAWNSVRCRHRAVVVSLCAALAYHSHPSSIVAAICLGLWITLQAWQKQTPARAVVVYGLTFFLVALPWLVWTKLVLDFPSNMIWQNFAGPGTEAAMASPLNFIWIRVVNAYNTFMPFAFGVYPFEFQRVLRFTAASLPFAVGLLVIIPALRECQAVASSEPSLFWFGLVAPAAIILLLYSCPAFPVLHGWQPLIGALVFLGVFRIERNLTRRWFAAVILLQIALNLGLVGMHGWHAGVHLVAR